MTLEEAEADAVQATQRAYDGTITPMLDALTRLLAEHTRKELMRPCPFLAMIPSKTDFLENTARFAYPDQQPKSQRISIGMPARYKEQK